MSEQRLIDANALMEDINESLRKMTSIGIAVDGDWLWAKLNDAIEHAPTIKERKKGKWISNSPVTMRCNQCAYVASDWIVHEFHYCPNCGADMREEGEK